MTPSESFSSQDTSQSYVYRASIEFTDLSSRGSAINASGGVPSLKVEGSALKPLSEIAHEESLMVLRRELQKAHQLLAHQRSEMRDLVEQADRREIQLRQVQQERENLQQTCDRQAEQMVDMQSICRDLKTQLRRQQQRVLQYRTLLDQTQQGELFSGSLQPLKEHPCESHPPEAINWNEEVSKISVDEEWILKKTQRLMGPAVAHQKLLTLGLSTASMLTNSKNESSLTKVYEDITIDALHTVSAQGKRVDSTTKVQVELPCFTQTHSR
jgi:hypothetical protein